MTEIETKSDAQATAASEEEPPRAAVDDEESSPPENDAEGGANNGAVTGSAAAAAATAAPSDGKGNNVKVPQPQGNNKRGGGRGKKPREEKDQVPIEELYDLTKPIKRIDRPTKENHDAEIAVLDAAIDSLKTERGALQSKIDSARGKDKDSSPLAKERDALNRLKNRKGLMIEQKRQLRAQLEASKAEADKLSGRGAKSTKGSGTSRFGTNVADIEKEINRLQRKQETSSMSLAEEKKLIKEIESLQAARRTAEELRAKKGDLDTIREDRKAVQAELVTKDKEIDAIQREIDAQVKVVERLREKQSGQRGAVEDLIKRRDQLKNEMDAKYKEKGELNAKFRERTNEWYQNQRAIKAQRQLQYEEEKKKREEERQAWLKKKEEEELAKTPYEEEMALCDYLADHLTKTYLMDEKEEAEKQAKAAEEKSRADVVAIKEDPFAGLKAVGKKKADEDKIYFGKGKGAKKKGKPKKANKQSTAAKTFSLNLDLFDQFGMISLSPPTSLDAVHASVEELRAKKKWYSEQPRGSVPTARDIRKANAEAAAKARGDGNAEKGGSGGRGGKRGNKKGFDIADESEFVPLGAGAMASGANNGSWGRNKDDSGEANADGDAAGLALS